MIRFQCPQCRGVLEASDQTSGEKINCPSCGQRLQIPPPASDPPRNKTVLGTPVSPLSSPQPHSASLPGPSKSVIISCPTCSARIPTQASSTEKQVQCPKCGAAFRVKVKGKSDTQLPLAATGETAPPASPVQPLAPPQPDAAAADSTELAWVRRLLSLPWLILILVFGLLPWSEWNVKKVLELRFQPEAVRHKPHLADTVVPLLYTQSGYQALYGGTNSPLDVREQVNRPGLLLNFRRSSFLMTCSPFMTVFWTAALAMLALVWWTPLSASRLKTFLAFVGLMTAMLLITQIWGTLLELNAQRDVEKVAKEDLKAGLIMNAANTRGKTLWFWLTFAAVLLIGVSEAVSNLKWKTRDFVSPIAFIGIRIAAVILAGTGVGLQIIFWTMYGIDVDEGDGKSRAEPSSLVWWTVGLLILGGVLAIGAIWLYQKRARYIRVWSTALANRTDREFLREVIQLSLFALAVSVIGGAFADFFAPKAPLSLIFSAGLAAAALLCLILFPIFRRQGLGLAAFCLLCVAFGFGVWWGLAAC